MNKDSYKIIISLSHHRIAFEYWLRDGENKLVPMPYMTWPAPLAFYCSQNGIEIGESAVRAVHSGTSNAFDNYFERLTNDGNYVYGGQNKPLRYLLLDACESIFEVFFKKVLFGSKGSLSDNRATMPITLVCESDVRPNERVLLTELFKGSGYNRFKVAEYNDFINVYIRKSIATNYACENVLVVWTEDSDLTFTLFELNKTNERYLQIVEGLGKDPRREYVKNLIWKRIKGQNQWLRYEDEEDTISAAASKFFSTNLPLVESTLLLSDGVNYHYSLNRANVDNLKCGESSLIRSKLDEFLSQYGLADRRKTLLLLRGIAAGNTFFEQALCSGFANTIRSDSTLRTNTMHLLIDDSMHNKVQENSSISKLGAGEKTDVVASLSTRASVIDEKDLKSLKREFRNLKMEFVSLIDRGDSKGADLLIESFIARVKPLQINIFDEGLSELKTKIKEKTREILKKNINQPNIATHTIPKKPNLEDREEMRSVIAAIRAAMEKKELSLAHKIGSDFLIKMHSKGIHSFDEKVEEKLQGIKLDHKHQEQPDKADSKINQPSKRDERDFRILESSISAKLNSKDYSSALSEIVAFKNQMHERNIHAFDDNLKTLQTQIRTYKSKNK